MATKKTAWKKQLPFVDFVRNTGNDKLELAFCKKYLTELTDSRSEYVRDKRLIEHRPDFDDLDMFEYEHYESICMKIYELDKSIKEVRARISNLSKKVNQKRTPKSSYSALGETYRFVYPSSEYYYPVKASGKKRTAKRVSSKRK